jgi:hypothetical protein
LFNPWNPLLVSLQKNDKTDVQTKCPIVHEVSDKTVVCQNPLYKFKMIYAHLWGWPEPYINGVYTVFLAEITKYTV